jgi:hypothetical protein
LLSYVKLLNPILAFEKIKLNDFKKSYELSRNRILEIIEKNSHTLKELYDVPYHFLRYISSIPLNLDYFSAFQMDLGMEWDEEVSFWKFIPAVVYLYPLNFERFVL